MPIYKYAYIYNCIYTNTHIYAYIVSAGVLLAIGTTTYKCMNYSSRSLKVINACYLLMSNRNLKFNMVRIELGIPTPRIFSSLLNPWLLKPKCSLESLSISLLNSCFISIPWPSLVLLSLNLEVALLWQEWNKSSGLLNCPDFLNMSTESRDYLIRTAKLRYFNCNHQKHQLPAFPALAAGGIGKAGQELKRS